MYVSIKRFVLTNRNKMYNGCRSQNDLTSNISFSLRHADYAPNSGECQFIGVEGKKNPRVVW